MNYNLRYIEDRIKRISSKDRGRIIVITGARQVGKTTLAQENFSDYSYLSMDTALERDIYEKYSSSQWKKQYPMIILDEVQKLPELFNTVKACYDKYSEMRFILLGSSQVLLLKGVRETLAGRAAIQELYPYSLAELCGEGNRSVILDTMLSNPSEVENIISEIPVDIVLSEKFSDYQLQWKHLAHWGGMPRLTNTAWDDEDRFEWLQDYCQTYLQRDLSDLANLERLEPFVRAQKVAALRTSQLLNYADLARSADISPPTSKNFIHYLELSYQVHLLAPWTRNKEKRLSKMPKLHFIDNGIRRAILRTRGDLRGDEFESVVISEVLKIIKNGRHPWEMYHLRTSDGREIDLLLECEEGYIAIECKMSLKVGTKDIRHFRKLDDILDKPLLLGLVISNENEIKHLGSDNEPFYNLPAPLLFSSFTAITS